MYDENEIRDGAGGFCVAFIVTAACTGFFDVRGNKPAIARVSVLFEEADENIGSSRFGRILARDEGRFYPDEAFGGHYAL
ncbi:predicted protein [Bacillus sp. FW1]|nr:predicted protein [Bacillus sp. FW1]